MWRRLVLGTTLRLIIVEGRPAAGRLFSSNQSRITSKIQRNLVVSNNISRNSKTLDVSHMGIVVSLLPNNNGDDDDLDH